MRPIIIICAEWQKLMVNSFYDGEVLHFGNLPPQNKTLELVYGSNVTGINVEIKAVHINPNFTDITAAVMQSLLQGKLRLPIKGFGSNSI